MVGVDFGTLSGRAVVVRVARRRRAGAAPCTSTRTRVLDRDAARTAPSLPPDWALQVPGGLRRGAARGGAGGRRAGPASTPPTSSASAPTSPPARWCPTTADGTPLCELRRARRQPARLRQALEAPRRPAAGRPDQRARRRARRGLAPPLRRADLLGVGVRQGAAAPRGGPRGLRRDGALGRGRRLDRLAADRRLRPQRLHRRLQGHPPGRQLPLRGLPGRAQPRLRAASSPTRSSTASASSATRAGRLTAEAAALDRPARGHRRRGRQRRRARHRAGRPRRRARPDGRDHGHLDLPRHEQRPAASRSRACAASSTAASSPACGATRPGRAASATSSAGSSTHGVPPEYHAAAAERGLDLHEHLTDLAAEQAVGEHGLVALDWHSGNRSVLVDHELSGLVVGQTLATRPEDVYRALLEATAFGTRTIVEAFVDAGVPVDRARRRRRPAEEPAADADLRRRHAPAAVHHRLRAGPGARLGDPRRGRRRRLPRRARRRRGDGPLATGRVYQPIPANARRTTRCSPSTRSCTTTSAAAATTSCTGSRGDAPAAGRRGDGSPTDGSPAAAVATSDRHDGPADVAVRHRRVPAAEVAELHAELTRYELVVWTAGNVSARVPGADLLVIKPSGVSYDDARPRSPWSSPTWTARSSTASTARRRDTAAHAYVYRHMPEVGGVVHTHSTYATAWAARGEPIPCVAHHDRRRVRRRDPGRPVRPHRRRLDRPGHRRHPARQPLARRVLMPTTARSPSARTPGPRSRPP